MFQRIKPILIAAVAIVAAGFAPARVSAAPFIADASFETPALAASGYSYDPSGTGWTFTSVAGISANGGPFYVGNAPGGTQAAFLQTLAVGEGSPVGGNIGQFSQLVTGLTANTAYAIQFDLASRNGFATDAIDVTFGGVDLGTFSNNSTAFIAQTTASAIAASTSAVLTFTSSAIVGGTEKDAAVDLVTITAVPEPASMALLATGLLGLTALRRRSQA